MTMSKEGIGRSKLIENMFEFSNGIKNLQTLLLQVRAAFKGKSRRMQKSYEMYSRGFY